MNDADGAPISYLALRSGIPVYTADGAKLGAVARVVQVAEKDLFEGLVVETMSGPRFVDRDDVASIAERAVRLTIDTETAGRLTPPSGTPTFAADPTEGAGRSFRGWWNRTFRRGGWKRVS